MIDACEGAGVKLMIAYRLHFDPANLRAVEVAHSGRIGELRAFDSLFTMQVKDQDNIRLRAESGGPLYDIGIYCINAARYLFRAEPIQVAAITANNGERRFAEVEEMAAVTLRFPEERLATFVASFGAADHASWRLVGTKGELSLDQAYEYAEEMTLRTKVGERTTEKRFAPHDQFAPELLHFSDCVLGDREPEPNGREGWADVRILRAIKAAAASGRLVDLAPFEKRRRPEPRQATRRPPVEKPQLVNATSPGSEQ
jgi:predicted dehydrogenase